LPKNLRHNEGSLLIAAVSGRALARSARRAGFTPLVADFFADEDTKEAAHACRKMPGSIKRGFRWQSLYPALHALAERAPSPILGFVYGAGFEDRPELLTAAAQHWPLLGTDAATVHRLKTPQHFFAKLDRLGIAHPPTASVPQSREMSWLAKRRGGAGGSHIVPSHSAKPAANVYFQQRVDGYAVSALFVANGSSARMLGFSEQWTALLASSPWRYGGAASPAAISTALRRQMSAAVQAISSSFPIKGLASADFLVRDGEPLLLEINARPGATLDIFDRGAKSLLRFHIEAARDGTLPPRALRFPDAMASSIVYAERGGPTPVGMEWPGWVADRPKPLEWIDKDRPICTVLARAASVARAKRLVEARKRKILALFQGVIRGHARERQDRKGKSAPGLAERQRSRGTAGQGAHR
jgi:predicted ATP-grasp superfamily ATP-dependent carboligase